MICIKQDEYIEYSLTQKMITFHTLDSGRCYLDKSAMLKDPMEGILFVPSSSSRFLWLLLPNDGNAILPDIDVAYPAMNSWVKHKKWWMSVITLGVYEIC